MHVSKDHYIKILLLRINITYNIIITLKNVNYKQHSVVVFFFFNKNQYFYKIIHNHTALCKNNILCCIYTLYNPKNITKSINIKFEANNGKYNKRIVNVYSGMFKRRFILQKMAAIVRTD